MAAPGSKEPIDHLIDRAIASYDNDRFGVVCRRRRSQFSGVSGGIAGRQTKGESLSAEEVGDLPQLQSASPPVGSLVDDQNVGTRGSQRLSPTMGFWLVSLRWFCFPRNGQSDDSFRRPRCPCGRASRLGQKTRPQGTQGGGGSAAALGVVFPAEVLAAARGFESMTEYLRVG